MLASSLLQNANQRWCDLYTALYGDITFITRKAANLAGGWKRLYKAKQIQNRESLPWEGATEFEIEASVDFMMAPDGEKSISSAHRTPSTTSTIVFLIDGSGSVTEEDFSCMTNFVRSVCQRIISRHSSLVQHMDIDKRDEEVETAAAGGGTSSNSDRTLYSRDADEISYLAELQTCRHRVALIQFSNDVRVELDITDLTSEALADGGTLDAALRGIQRMNGGTNIAAALQKAGRVLKQRCHADRSVLALLTDGRIDRQGF